MNASGFFSQAGNFASAVSGGVDPRTGLYNVQITLGHLVGNCNLGPSLPLTLSYSPLNWTDTGFGKGFSLGLTVYDADATRTLLALSTGEQYKVDEGTSSVRLRQKKLDTVHFTKEADSYRVVHKSGDVEILTGPRNAYTLKVPTELLTPAGHRLKLSWDYNGAQPRLSKVEDDDHVTLLTVQYSVSKTTMAVLPGRTEGYTVEVWFTNGLLSSVHHSGTDGKTLEWTFASDTMGALEEWGTWITGVTAPGGMSEKAYYTNEGHKFPDSSPLTRLPYVMRMEQRPGAGQPLTETSYKYTDTNFVGGHSGVSWDPNRDNLYEVLEPYTYGSTESRKCSGRTESTIRCYNSYHLLTVEERQQNQCKQRTDTVYYALDGTSLDLQPPQFQLPKKRTVTWSGPSGGTRSEVTTTGFDEAGNPTKSQTLPDGPVTEWSYYPKEGSGSDCPPEPNGFTRLLKSVTRTPASTSLGEPVYRTVYRYTAHTRTAPRMTAVLKAQEQHCADGRLLTEKAFAYTTSDAGEFGRVTRFSETEYPDGKSKASYTATHDFAFTLSGNTLAQSHTLTAHDGLAVTRSQKRSRFTGRLESATDAQGNADARTFDTLGRTLAHTLNPQSAYSARTTFGYRTGGDAPFTVTTTDALGNRLRETLDGAGRPVKREHQDTDSDDRPWYTAQTLAYDARGRLVSTCSQDQVRGSSTTPFTFTRNLVYDDWGRARAVTGSDGSRVVSETDPVKRTTTTQLYGGATPVTGKTVTFYNTRGHPVGVERWPITGTQAYSSRSLVRDSWDRVRSETDECGNTTLHDYDARGRLTATTLPDGTRITRTYAPFSSAALLTGLAVNGVSYGTQSFDGLGRVTSSRSGGRTWTHHYAAAGDPLPSAVTQPDGTTRNYTYTPQLRNALAQVVAGSITQKFARHPATGRLTKAEEGSATISRGYYPSGRLKSDTTTLPGHGARTATWTWTVGGREQSYTADGATRKTTPDAHGRIATVEDEAVEVTLSYDSAGRLSGWTTTDKQSQQRMVTALTLDDEGREIKRSITGPRGTEWTLIQTWQKNDLLSTRTLARDGITTLRQESFTYTSRNQLSTYTCEGGEPPTDEGGRRITSQSFTYNAHGNITSCTTGFSTGTSETVTYAFSPTDPCQLTTLTRGTSPAIQLVHDAAGRLTCDDHGRTLTYDALGRLQSAGTAGQYTYDPLNRLSSQKQGAALSLLYYRGRRLAAVAEGERTTLLHQLGPGCAAQHTSGGSRPTQTRLLGTDGKRTVLASAIGGSAQEYAYTAYGYRSADKGSVLGYDGERTDPALGWLHLGNGYRSYHPGLMRFTAPDGLSPFGAGGINPYIYCEGDPVNRTDPSGHLSWQAWLGIGIGVAGLALAAFTAGASIAAAGGVMAALSAASTTSLVVGAFGAVSDVTAIASGALEETSPKTSSILGWVSLGTGLAGLATHAGMAAAKGLPRLAGETAQAARTAETGVSEARSFSFTYSELGEGAENLTPRTPPREYYYHGVKEGDMDKVLAGIRRPENGTAGNYKADWKAFYLADTQKQAHGYAEGGGIIRVKLPEGTRVEEVDENVTAEGIKARFGIDPARPLMDALGEQGIILRMPDGTGEFETIVPWNLAEKLVPEEVLRFENRREWMKLC
jgi:RHS repeat-associated protein